MQLGRIVAQLGFAVVAIATLGSTAQSDVLEGSWCAVDGRRIAIDAQSVTAPDGTRIEAEYDAHHVLFLMPSKGTHAVRREADIVLLNDNVAHVRFLVGKVGDHALVPEVWRRCIDLTSSLSPVSPAD